MGAWSQIAAGLQDVDLDTYNQKRSEYFDSVVKPRLRPQDVGKYRGVFMANTTRTAHLDGQSIRHLEAAHAGASVLQGMLEQTINGLKLIGEPTSERGARTLDWLTGHVNNLQRYRDKLGNIYSREKGTEYFPLPAVGGLPFKVLSLSPRERLGVSDTVANQVPQLALWELTGGPALKILEETKDFGTVGNIIRNTLGVGALQGAMSAAGADPGQRWHEGIKGATWGAGLTAGTSLAGYGILRSLQNRLLRAGVDTPADELMQHLALGNKIDPRAEKEISTEMAQGMEGAKREARPISVVSNKNIKGVWVRSIMPDGNIRHQQIVPGNERVAALDLLEKSAFQGLNVQEIQHSPRSLKDALRFQGILGEEIARKSRIKTLIRVTPGSAQKVADDLTASGVPAEPHGADKVQVHVVAEPAPPSLPKLEERPPLTPESEPGAFGEALWPFTTPKSVVRDTFEKLQRPWPGVPQGRNTTPQYLIKHLQQLTDADNTELPTVINMIKQIPDMEFRSVGGEGTAVFNQTDRDILMQFASDIRNSTRPAGISKPAYERSGLLGYIADATGARGNPPGEPASKNIWDVVVRGIYKESIQGPATPEEAESRQRWRNAAGLKHEEEMEFIETTQYLSGTGVPGLMTRDRALRNLIEKYPSAIESVLRAPEVPEDLKSQLRPLAVAKSEEISRIKRRGSPAQPPNPAEQIRFSVAEGGTTGQFVATNQKGKVLGSSDNMQELLNRHGHVTFPVYPAGETPVADQLHKVPDAPKGLITKLFGGGKLFGSIEDIKNPAEARMAVGSLARKGYSVKALPGWEPGRAELLYFKEGMDQSAVDRVAKLYERDILSQREPWKYQPLNPDEHRVLGRAFGIDPKEIDSFLDYSAKYPRVRGSAAVAEAQMRRGRPAYLNMSKGDIGKRSGGTSAFYMQPGSQKSFWGYEVPGLPKDYPLIVTTELASPGSVFHELVHDNLFNFQTYHRLMSDPNLKVINEIADSKYIGNRYHNYPRTLRAEEAVAHAFEAIHTGDMDMLTKLAEADTDMRSVLDMANEVAAQMRERSGRMPDSAIGRSMKGMGFDIGVRTDRGREGAFRRAAARQGETFDAIDINPDGSVTVHNQGRVQTFSDMHEAFNHYLKYDPYIAGPNMGGIFEAVTRGSINPIVPDGHEPFTTDPSDLPSPEALPEGGLDALAHFVVSDWVRPPFQWLNDLHISLNKRYVGEGKYIPLYETFSKIFDKQRDYETQSHQMGTKLFEFYKNFEPKQGHEITRWLAHSSGFDRQKLEQLYQFTPEQVGHLKGLESWLNTEAKEMTGGRVDLVQYLQNEGERLRGHGFDADKVWGVRKKGDTSQAGFFEKHIRVDEDLRPEEGHIGRFAYRALQLGIRDKLMEKDLFDAREMLKLRDKDKKSLLGPPVRSLRNYLDYMDRKPDITRTLMNQLASGLFQHMNDKIESINKVMPEGWKIPKIDTPGYNFWNYYIMLHYSAGLAFRPVVWVRDASQGFLTNFPTLGPEYFAKGIRAFADADLRKLPGQHGVLLNRGNIGDMFGDVSDEIPPQRVKPFLERLLSMNSGAHNIDRSVAFLGQRQRALDAFTKWFGGGYGGAVGHGGGDLDKAIIDSGLWFFDEMRIAQYKRELLKPWLSEDLAAYDRTLTKFRAEQEGGRNTLAGKAEQLRLRMEKAGTQSERNAYRTELEDAEKQLKRHDAVVKRMEDQRSKVEATAKLDFKDRLEELVHKTARDYVDLTQWPYRTGTQPGLLRTGAGRLFGMYGVWSAHYREFLWRMGKRFAWDSVPSVEQGAEYGKREVRNPYRMAALKTAAYWAAASYTLQDQVFKRLGVDTHKWFWHHGAAGIGALPLSETAKTIIDAGAHALEGDTPEGRKARRGLYEYPFNFLPGSAAIRWTAKVTKKVLDGEEVNPLEWLGFQPLKDLNADQDLIDSLEEEFGTSPPKKGGTQ